MFTSRLFWKLLITCSGIGVAATIFLAITIAQQRGDHLVAEFDEHLELTSSRVGDHLSELLASKDSQQAFDQLKHFANLAGVDFLVLGPRGKILAETSAEPDHDFKDLATEQLGAPGLHVVPGTGDRYVVRRVANERPGEVFLCTLVQRTKIDKKIRAARTVVYLVAAIVVLGSVGLTYWVTHGVLQPIMVLQKAVDAVAGGNYHQRVYVSNRDEIGWLATAFNHMSQEIDSRISQLRQNSQRQATVLGGMIEGVIAVDDRERILFANKAAGRLFDFVPSAIQGRSLLEVMRISALHEAAAGAIATQQLMRCETEWGSDDTLTISVQATPLSGDPCPGVVLVMHDVTELRRLETLRQDFVANVSHELKTPLSSIKAYAETLQNGALEDKQNRRRVVGYIEEQADRLHHLIVDMLAVARIESEDEMFEINSVSIQEGVHESIESRRASLDAKQIKLQWYATDPALGVRADQEALREILDNLLDNAVKYTPNEGKVTVHWEPEGESARIAVEDTGMGIAGEHLDRIFERFYRVDKARSREMGGTGLGLSIVKQLVEVFGGSTEVQSERGKGTTFFVRLPLV